MDREVMEAIDESFAGRNPYYESFKMMHEVEEEEAEKAELEGKKMPKIRLLFDINANVDTRRYKYQGQMKLQQFLLCKIMKSFPKPKA